MVNPSDLPGIRAASMLEARGPNANQLRQDAITCEIVIPGLEIVTGSSEWTSAFAPTIIVPQNMAHLYGGVTTVNTLDYLRTQAALNGTSFERTALSELISQGYQLKELDVEIAIRHAANWGVCSWYKDHPTYHDPKLFAGSLEGTPEQVSFLIAMFKTERAGDQRFTLVSGEVIREALSSKPRRFLFHGALFFRRVVLSLPPQRM